MKIKRISDFITRICEKNDSMLTRYGIFNDRGANEECFEGNTAHFDGGKRKIDVFFSKVNNGFEIKIPLSENERIFGGGDVTRERIMHRGTTLRMSVVDFVGYGPLSVLFSTDGWGVLINCTYDHLFDIGDSDKNTLRIFAPKGTLDFYIFTGKSLVDLMEKYTFVAGRPAMLPKFAYGFLFVENEETDARSFLWDIKNFRERNIPCDMLGLEPTWMPSRYDYSINKSWSKERFPLPSWFPANQSGERTFFYPMREMGMNLSLWLCCNYDLFYKEETDAGQSNLAENRDDINRSNAPILDERLIQGVKRLDYITKKDEPWFEHLKKFVDNGAAAFKMDGADQVLRFPDRLWGGKFHDDEAHNAFPVVLAKQMSTGFRDYTGRRPLIYTACAFAGSQQYAASWTGDTGGDEKTMVAIFNYCMGCHSNVSCDLEVTTPEKMHYGFMLPYSQFLCWAQWQYPWFLSEDKERMIRRYSKLRSSLFPYLYAMAHKANRTGLPILRPLPLIYEDSDRFDNTKNMYMLGDDLLIGVFDMNLDLPDGVWVDYFTGKEYSGNVKYDIPEGYGGAILVRKGSLIFTMKEQKYLLEKDHEYILKVYPGADCKTTLVEDDGWTFDYEKGLIASTTARIENSHNNGFELCIDKRKGEFFGRPDNGHDSLNNSIPEIKAMTEQGSLSVSIVNCKASSITLNGNAIEFTHTDNNTCFIVSSELLKNSDLRFVVKY